MWPFRSKSNQVGDISDFKELAARIEKLSIPVVMDDWDAGFDTAIDEVLAILYEKIQKSEAEKEVDYSGGY
jgi:hypothetical protein